MKQVIINKEDIVRQLYLMPSEYLKEIESYIQFVINKYDRNKDLKNEPETLAGIWKNKGFELITDINNEINEIRSSISNQVLNKGKQL